MMLMSNDENENDDCSVVALFPLHLCMGVWEFYFYVLFKYQTREVRKNCESSFSISLCIHSTSSIIFFIRPHHHHHHHHHRRLAEI